jgi:signal recognition particle subunit SRP72
LSTKKVAQNNASASSARTLNPYLNHRISNSLRANSGAHLPFKFQEELFDRNAFILDVLCLKYQGVERSTSAYLQKSTVATTSSTYNNISVINALAHAEGAEGKAALKLNLPLRNKFPKNVGIVLTIVQLYMLTNNYGDAIASLESFLRKLEESSSDDDHITRVSPGIIGLMNSLYSIQHRKSKIREELAKAANSPGAKSPNLLIAAGRALVESSREEDLTAARKVFEGLNKHNLDDKIVSAGIVASHATGDAKSIQQHAEKLTPVSRLIAGVDIDALEDAGIATLSDKPAASSKKRPAKDSEKPSKKRVRKNRLPKDYDSKKTMDPERWLPLKDRSTYRPKGKKGKAKAAAATQGGAVDESLAMAGGASEIKVEKVGGPGGASKAKNKNKKKGKK